MRSWVEGGRKTQSVGERERDIRGTGRDRPRQGDELLVKWLLFSWRASQLHFSGFSYSFPQRGAKEKNYWKHWTLKIMLDWWDHLEEPQTGLRTWTFTADRHKVTESLNIFNTIWGSFVWNHIRFSRNISKIPGIFPPDPQNSLNYILRNCSTKKIPTLSRTLLRFSPSAQESPDFADHTQAWI